MRKSPLSVLLFGLGLASAPGGAAATSPADEAARNFILAAPQNLTETARRPIWVTAYIVRPAKEDTSASAVPLLTEDGKASGIGLSHADWCHGAMEGTLVVALAAGGSRTFNYARMGPQPVTHCSDIFPRADQKKIAAVSRSLFAPAPRDAPFGLGDKSRYRLVPYRSIAVDLAPGAPFGLETVLFIPRLKDLGFTLPDGRRIVHDGYVVAVDRGGLVSGIHVDFFKGPSMTDALPTALRSNESAPIDAYIVADPVVSSALVAQHRRR